MYSLGNFEILAQYTKKLSMDNPGILTIMASQEGERPQIHVDIQAKGRPVADEVFEVVLDIVVEAKKEEERVFRLELSYASLVKSPEKDESNLGRLLMVNVPFYLFPYARTLVSDVTRDSGYPPLFLNPVDFAELYEKQR